MRGSTESAQVPIIGLAMIGDVVGGPVSSKHGTSWAQRYTSLRHLLYAVLWILMASGTCASGQGRVLNDAHEQLLALEAETPVFWHYEGVTLQGFAAQRRRGEPLGASELVEAQLDAASLHGLAQELLQRANVLSEGLHLSPGVELDADMMYRFSAWQLSRFFAIWSDVLVTVQDANSMSPASFWLFTEDMESAGEAYDMARIYRILANQQYVLEQSGVWPF